MFDLDAHEQEVNLADDDILQMVPATREWCKQVSRGKPLMRERGEAGDMSG